MGNLVGQSRIALAVRQTIRILNFGFIDLKLRSSISKPTESNYYLLISTSTTHTFYGLSFSAQAIVRPQNKNTQSLDRAKKVSSDEFTFTIKRSLQTPQPTPPWSARNPISCFGKCSIFFCVSARCESICQTSFIRWLHPLKWLHFFSLHFLSVVAHSIDLKPFHLFRLMQFWTSDRNLFCVFISIPPYDPWSKFEYLAGNVWVQMKNRDPHVQMKSEREKGKKLSLMLAANVSCPLLNILPTKIYVPKLSQ